MKERRRRNQTNETRWTNDTEMKTNNEEQKQKDGDQDWELPRNVKPNNTWRKSGNQDQKRTRNVNPQKCKVLVIVRNPIPKDRHTNQYRNETKNRNLGKVLYSSFGLIPEPELNKRNKKESKIRVKTKPKVETPKCVKCQFHFETQS